MKRIILAAVLLMPGLIPGVAAKTEVCVLVHQVGVIRDANPEDAQRGYPFPCDYNDDQAFYLYRHGKLRGQEGWWWRGFDPSTGKVD